MKKLLITLFILLPALWASAQENGTNPDQATGLRADGKIYVVLAVAITILLGLIIYVIRLDRKISKLEKGQ
ncbi:CcmD family protein [Paraflavitalea soli]|uniref:CcmD family protein n=1 Tax=Paraflavitalea soli TaxID=2315862 RepID=A0A3B7MZZ9_9BACT|nr:CcmD family protein [Paraflavitalea soli]AXY78670.1 CcmD family protein [Paraflavitalea soli]